MTNQIIREALHPYPDDLVIVTKVGARRGARRLLVPRRLARGAAAAPSTTTCATSASTRSTSSTCASVASARPAAGLHRRAAHALAELQRQGLIRHLGLSNVTAAQVAEARPIAQIVCVQNHYNLAHREDDAIIDELAAQGIAYVPFFPLGGFTPLQSTTLDAVATRPEATPMQVALAWLLHRSPNILLIPGTSSVAHLRDNVAAAGLTLPEDAVAELDAIAG